MEPVRRTNYNAPSLRLLARTVAYLQMVFASAVLVILIYYGLIGYIWTQAFLNSGGSRMRSWLAYFCRTVYGLVFASMCVQLWASIQLLEASEIETSAVRRVQITRRWRKITWTFLVVEFTLCVLIFNMWNYGLIATGLRIVSLWMVSTFTKEVLVFKANGITFLNYNLE